MTLPLPATMQAPIERGLGQPAQGPMAPMPFTHVDTDKSRFPGYVVTGFTRVPINLPPEHDPVDDWFKVERRLCGLRCGDTPIEDVEFEVVPEKAGIVLFNALQQEARRLYPLSQQLPLHSPAVVQRGELSELLEHPDVISWTLGLNHVEVTYADGSCIIRQLRR